jgi:hypothetical protein
MYISLSASLFKEMPPYKLILQRGEASAFSWFTETYSQKVNVLSLYKIVDTIDKSTGVFGTIQ